MTHATIDEVDDRRGFGRVGRGNGRHRLSGRQRTFPIPEGQMQPPPPGYYYGQPQRYRGPAPVEEGYVYPRPPAVVYGYPPPPPVEYYDYGPPAAVVLPDPYAVRRYPYAERRYAPAYRYGPLRQSMA